MRGAHGDAVQGHPPSRERRERRERDNRAMAEARRPAARRAILVEDPNGSPHG